MRQKTRRRIFTAVFAMLAFWCVVAHADNAIYVCRTNGVGSPTYMRFDEKLHTVSQGRTQVLNVVTPNVIFNRSNMTWSRTSSNGTTWNFTFDKLKGTLDYGWGKPPGGFWQQDICKLK